MILTGETIYLRFLEEGDAEALLDLHTKNREFFQLYSPQKNADFYTFDIQLDRIRLSKENIANDRSFMFGIFLKKTDELIGDVTLMEVLRGGLQSCYIGYMLDKSQNGKGLMTEAVRLAAAYAFNELKLHRIEAGVMPHNLGSIRVLEKAGFHKEGIAKKNVKINGKWEDHQVLAILNPEED